MSKQICSCCTSNKLKYTSSFFLLLSLTFLSVAFWVPDVIDHALDSGITDFLALTPESRASGTQGYVTWSDWTDSRAPVVWYNVWIFNLTNPNEVIAGEKPVVKEVGPYVYREYKIKKNTHFSYDDEGHAIVRYQDYVYYVFDAERTGPHLNPLKDTMLTTNFIFEAIKGGLTPGLEYGLLEVIYPTGTGVGQYNDSTRLFKTFNVNEFLWGYNDTKLWEVTCAQSCQLFPGVLTNITEAMVPAIPYDSIYTGDGVDPALTRQYVEWQEMAYLKYPLTNPTIPLWNTPQANRVRGTDGTQFARNLDKGTTIVAFISELYRAGSLINHNGQVNTYKGIDLLHFTIDPKLLANSSVNPSSADYNINGPEGMLDISKETQNIPIYLTKPHFLDVGLPVSNNTKGLTPKREIHDTFIDVEPITGAAMNAAKRIQINVQLGPVTTVLENWFTKTNNNTLVPSVWVEEAGALSDDQAHDFKSQVYLARSARYYVKWVSYPVGITFGVLCLFIFFVSLTRARTEMIKSIQSHDELSRYEPLLDPSSRY